MSAVALVGVLGKGGRGGRGEGGEGGGQKLGRSATTRDQGR